MKIPFNIPFISGQEMFYLKTALGSGQCGSEGLFVDRCKEWFATHYKNPATFLTPSCSDALEMAALISGAGPGDEVIVPSWTHVSSANAFVLRGATIVFADIDPDTITVSIEDVEKKITGRTKVVVAVHYGGYGAEAGKLRTLCDERKIMLVEDAAHSIGALNKGAYHGTIGHLGCISFHESKNIQCGEGGALLVNDPSLISTAESIFDKGTNRPAFLRGEVPVYEWLRPGSSFAMSNITAAMLLAQLQETDTVNWQRGEMWKLYREQLGNIPRFEKFCTLPPMPENMDEFNAHIFFIKADTAERAALIKEQLNKKEIQAQSHFPPLHQSPFGKQFRGTCPLTESESRRLIRLPIFHGLNINQIKRIATALEEILKKF